MKAFVLNSTVASAVILVATMAQALPNSGAPTPGFDTQKCAVTTNAAVAKAGVTDAQLISVVGRDTGNETPMPSTYDFTYSSSVCGTGGAIVVTTTDYCYVQQVFTRYNCRVPGLRHFSF